MSKIGLIHPGEMGISVAASALNNGHQVYWASKDRSAQTKERATKYDLIDVESLSRLCQVCEIIFSICPPHAAEDVAQSVIAASFKGLYLDGNAIAPQSSIKIGQIMNNAGVRFVDGGIIGRPAWNAKETWLYLAGSDAKEIASCFSKGPLETKIISEEIGKASALKMCYAAYSKGTTALLIAILATAESLGVRDNLYQQWDTENIGFSGQVNQRLERVTAKAWRFEGEMKEIAATFQAANLPAGFYEAAAEIYHRLAKMKKSGVTDEIDEILAAMSATTETD
jgi:3-hydroxyisobutyrate dehydrogenase-like beta-hydroxyacid dehydrogenase